MRLARVESKTQGLPGPRRCSCPTNLSSDLGRRASPSEAPAQARGTDRSSACQAKERLLDVAITSAPLGGANRKKSRDPTWDCAQRPNLSTVGLSETVGSSMTRDRKTEAHADFFRNCFLFPRQRFEPFETVLRAPVRRALEPRMASLFPARRRLAWTERLVEFPHGDLLEIFVIDPILWSRHRQ